MPSQKPPLLGRVPMEHMIKNPRACFSCRFAGAGKCRFGANGQFDQHRFNQLRLHAKTITLKMNHYHLHFINSGFKDHNFSARNSLPPRRSPETKQSEEGLWAERSQSVDVAVTGQAGI